MALNNFLRRSLNFLKFSIENNKILHKSVRTLSTELPALDKKYVQVTFVRPNGEKIKVKGKVGDSLLSVVIDNSVDLDGFGACEGTLTCSTCHLIFKKFDYDQIPNKPTDEEIDMLDLASDLTETSRLGCQVTLREDMDELEVRVPASIVDMR